MYDPADPILIAFFWCWVWFTSILAGLTAIDTVAKHWGTSWYKRSLLWWTLRGLWLVLLTGGMAGLARLSYLLHAANALDMLSWLIGIVLGICFFIALRNLQSRKDD